MTSPQDLRKSSKQDMLDFLDSFDTVFSDCDGVLWRLNDPIEGALPLLNKLEKLGKKVYFVTNNSLLSTEHYQAKLEKLGFNAKMEQIIHPGKVIAWYLKSIEFEGQAYVIASNNFKRNLINQGINVSPEGPHHLQEDDIRSILELLNDNPSIKAVIADFDINTNWLKLMQAIIYLKRDDCLFLVGGSDTLVPLGMKIPLIGPGTFSNILIKASGREPIWCAKSSEVLKQYLFNKCDISIPERCIFVGDTSMQDMKFGSLCGFKKLFVCSGVDTLEDTMKEEETTPDAHLPSLGHLLPLLETIPIENCRSTNGQ